MTLAHLNMAPKDLLSPLLSLLLMGLPSICMSLALSCRASQEKTLKQGRQTHSFPSLSEEQFCPLSVFSECPQGLSPSTPRKTGRSQHR